MHKHNRKAFFDSFAKENDFDPLVAENWYSVTGEKINRQKVCCLYYLLSLNII